MWFFWLFLEPLWGAQEADLGGQLLFSWEMGSETQQFFSNTTCGVYPGAGGTGGVAAAALSPQLLPWTAPQCLSPRVTSQISPEQKGRASPAASAACAGQEPWSATLVSLSPCCSVAEQESSSSALSWDCALSAQLCWVVPRCLPKVPATLQRNCPSAPLHMYVKLHGCFQHI